MNDNPTEETWKVNGMNNDFLWAEHITYNKIQIIHF